MKIDVYAVHA